MSTSRGNLPAVVAIVLALALSSGCGKSSTTGPQPRLPATFSIADIDYVKGVYYFLYDPNLDHLQIANADIRVYLDDFNFSNDQNSIPGRAFMDPGLTAGPNGTYGDPSVTDTTSVRGVFSPLYPGLDHDYQVVEMYGPAFKVLRLTRQLSGEQSLAVTYRAQRIGQGGTFEVGGQSTVESDGVERLYLKLLRPPASRVKPDPSGFYTPDNLFARTRDLELKNVYRLPGQRIDVSTFELTIRQGVSEPPVTSMVSQSGVSLPYLEVAGLDSYDQSGPASVPGHDGRVDLIYFPSGGQQPLVNFEEGILFFPDPRPFSPRIGDAYRLFPGGAALYPFDQAVSNALVRRDSLVGMPGAANGANVAIYDKHDAQRTLDAAYYIDVRFTAFGAPNRALIGTR